VHNETGGLLEDVGMMRCITLLLAALLGSAALAETVITKSGVMLQGRILQSNELAVTVEVPLYGGVSIRRDAIRIMYDKGALVEYSQDQAAIKELADERLRKELEKIKPAPEAKPKDALPPGLLEAIGKNKEEKKEKELKEKEAAKEAKDETAPAKEPKTTPRTPKSKANADTEPPAVAPAAPAPAVPAAPAPAVPAVPKAVPPAAPAPAAPKVEPPAAPVPPAPVRAF
jgi:hypothetical protein